MMDTFEKIVCSAAFGLVLGGVVLSVILTQDGAKAAGWPTQGSSSTLSASEKQFIQETANDERAEVELGKLAVRKASSREIREFGQKMIADHSATGEQVQKLATSKGISLGVELGKDDQAIRDRLAKMPKDQFDSAYMAEMLRDHEKNLQTFQQQSQAAQDREIRAFAAKTLPQLQSHLKLAETIAPDLRAEHTPRKKPSPAIAQTRQSTITGKGTGKAR